MPALPVAPEASLFKRLFALAFWLWLLSAPTLTGCRPTAPPLPTAPAAKSAGTGAGTSPAVTASAAPTSAPAPHRVMPLGSELAEFKPRIANSLHFLAFGDSGIGTREQLDVAARMGDVCRKRGCDFALHTGDILYPQGIRTVDDDKLRTHFEVPYAPLGIPLYLSLGNHDHYGNADAAIAYTDLSPSHAWVLPARYYTFGAAGVRFVALDTSMPDEAQARWAVKVLQRSRSAGEHFVVVYGHHPRLSYGAHGMAEPALAKWLDAVLCWRADVFIAGHDHDLQVLKPHCGVRQVITGASAQLRPVQANGVLSDFASSELGFLYATLDATGLHGEMLGTTGPGTEGGQVASRARIEVPVRSAATCAADGLCDGTCARDPDCRTGGCGQDGRCDATCMDDPDCAGLGGCPCDADPLSCDVRSADSREPCGCDPGCMRPK